MALAFPFSAVVGQDEMKLAILIAAVDPSIGGDLVFGDRGTGKSTAVRALAALLPKMRVVAGCPYGCDPAAVAMACAVCTAPAAGAGKFKERVVAVPGGLPTRSRMPGRAVQAASASYTSFACLA